MTTTPAGWTAYYERNATTPPERTLVAALDRFDEEAPGAARFAVDLGCGQGATPWSCCAAAGGCWRSTPTRTVSPGCTAPSAPTSATGSRSAWAGSRTRAGPRPTWSTRA